MYSPTFSEFAFEIDESNNTVDVSYDYKRYRHSISLNYSVEFEEIKEPGVIIKSPTASFDAINTQELHEFHKTLSNDAPLLNCDKNDLELAVIRAIEQQLRTETYV